MLASFLCLTFVVTGDTSQIDTAALYVGEGTEALVKALPLVERSRAIDYLLRILTTEKEDYVSQGHRASAAEMLGRLRATEAVDDLLAKIQITTSLPQLGPLGKYPAAVALVQIGTPALRRIPGYCARELGELELRLLALVVLRIDEPEFAKQRIIHVLETDRSEISEVKRRTGIDHTNHQKVRNLRKMIELLSDPNFDRAANWQ